MHLEIVPGLGGPYGTPGIKFSRLFLQRISQIIFSPVKNKSPLVSISLPYLVVWELFIEQAILTGVR